MKNNTLNQLEAHRQNMSREDSDLSVIFDDDVTIPVLKSNSEINRKDVGACQNVDGVNFNEIISSNSKNGSSLINSMQLSGKLANNDEHISCRPLESLKNSMDMFLSDENSFNSQDSFIPCNQARYCSSAKKIMDSETSLLNNLSGCFSEVKNFNSKLGDDDIFESSLKTADTNYCLIAKSFGTNLNRLSQSTPIAKTNININTQNKLRLKKSKELCDEDIPTTSSIKFPYQKSFLNEAKNMVNENNEGKHSKSNIPCKKLKLIHEEEDEPILENEGNTKSFCHLNDMSQYYKSSQYKQEIQDVFDVFEMTISHLNEDVSEIEPEPEKYSALKNLAPNIKTVDMFSRNTKRKSFQNSESQGPFYGLPLIAKSLVQQYKGIENLYDWQNECLTLPAIKNRDNLIYALPTSGGKTLVAELLMLREVVCRNKNVLFILPFVSIVQEKVWGLSPFAVGLHFLVEEYAGGKGVYPPRKRRTKRSIYVATLEKGLGLVRSLSENGRLGELGLIVVDELHLVGESSRGSTLEMLLTNVIYSGEDVQIVGMSATIGNIDELATFLNATVFTKDFRPVELKEYVKLGKNIYSIDWNAKTENDKLILDRPVDFGYSSQVEKIDADYLGGLVMEVIPSGSVLIFCPTKRSCENVALVLRKVIHNTLQSHKSAEKKLLQEAMKNEGCDDEFLLSFLEWGIAYHHSGLASEERKLVEEAFRSGVLSVICCTSTLAAGVNLPAQRVILRAPKIGRDFINLSNYKQMVGRAGRAGYGGHGDSILICAPHDVPNLKTLLNSPMDKASSNLHINDGAKMKSLILSAIALETATSRQSLRILASKTLLSVQAERLQVDLKQLVDKIIVALYKTGAIRAKNHVSNFDCMNTSVKINQTLHTNDNIEKDSHDDRTYQPIQDRVIISNDTQLIVSPLGKAAVKGGIELQRAHMLYADLKEAQKCFVLIGVIHLLYIVTPYEQAEVMKPDYKTFYSIYSTMGAEAIQLSKIIGFTNSTAVQMARGHMPKSIPERVLNRFYITLMLYDLWNQETLLAVSEKFQVHKGMVQALMGNTATFASCVLRFCQELEEFWAFKDLLSTFSQRISHCCISELVPLMELPNVKKNRALQLYKAGYKTLQSIARAKPVDLMESVNNVTINVANQLIAASKLLLLEKVENLREEAEDVIDGLGKL